MRPGPGKLMNYVLWYTRNFRKAHINEFPSQERKDVNIREAARLFHEKEQDVKRKEQGGDWRRIIWNIWSAIASNNSPGLSGEAWQGEGEVEGEEGRKEGEGQDDEEGDDRDQRQWWGMRWFAFQWQWWLLWRWSVVNCFLSPLNRLQLQWGSSSTSLGENHHLIENIPKVSNARPRPFTLFIIISSW